MRMEVIEVSKVIRKHTVLDRVSCSMHSGKIYGIQGKGTRYGTHEFFEL